MNAVTKNFVLAGDATFTIESPDGTHSTYRVQHVEKTDRWAASWFVKLLTGSDNTKDYTYLGKLDEFTGQVRTTAKSCLPQDHFKVRLLNRVLARVWGDDHQAFEAHGYKLHHEGMCCRCNRKLTHPTSIETGWGPECIKHMPGGLVMKIGDRVDGPAGGVMTRRGFYTGD